MPEIVLDLSRLLTRILHSTPTGVDRCEMAYARGLLSAASDRLSFAAVHPIAGYGRLPHEAVLRFLDLTEKRWESGGFRSIWEKRRFAASALMALLPRVHIPRAGRAGRVYVQASPNNLVDSRVIARTLHREQARFLCLVHDLIPLEFPEYTRPDGAEKHRARIETICNHASGIVTNSHATLASLKPWIQRSGRGPKTIVAHLGTHVTAIPRSGKSQRSRPYFVTIGTIEPRKNHLLLLNIWRRFAEQMGPLAIPKLILVGRRGWENEQVVDMLERCPVLGQCVEEKSGLPDRDTADLLVGSKALLLPSFAEGYGMPVAEALALGVPVICSDLPALREAGGDVPDFLDPLDGLQWIEAIRHFNDDGPRRQSQLEKVRDWQPPSWEDHMQQILSAASEISRGN